MPAEDLLDAARRSLRPARRSPGRTSRRPMASATARGRVARRLRCCCAWPDRRSAAGVARDRWCVRGLGQSGDVPQRFAKRRRRPVRRAASSTIRATRQADGRRIGPAAQADDEAVRAALAQVVEQAQRHRPGELLFLRCAGSIPTRPLAARRAPGSMSGQANGTGDLQRFGWPRLGLKARQPGAAHAAWPSTSITARGHVPGREGEPRPGGQQRARRGDQRAAVVDRPARLVAQQVGVDVAHAERPRAFEHEPLADLELAEGEVAGAGIEDHVDAVRATCRRRAGRPPRRPRRSRSRSCTPPQSKTRSPMRVLAGRRSSIVSRTPARPGLEPARLVVQAVAGQELLGDEARDPAVDRQAGAVEQGVAGAAAAGRARRPCPCVAGTISSSILQAVSCSPGPWKASSQP